MADRNAFVVDTFTVNNSIFRLSVGQNKHFNTDTISIVIYVVSKESTNKIKIFTQAEQVT